MRRFNILPFEGAGPVRFGMTPSEVHECIGEPSSVRTNRFGERDEEYFDVGAGYARSDETLIELGFVSSASVTFRGIDLFRDRRALSMLVEADGAPVQGLGFIVFPALGIALADFFSDQECDRAITVFARGRWTDLKDVVPFSIAAANRQD